MIRSSRHESVPYSKVSLLFVMGARTTTVRLPTSTTIRLPADHRAVSCGITPIRIYLTTVVLTEIQREFSQRSVLALFVNPTPTRTSSELYRQIQERNVRTILASMLGEQVAAFSAIPSRRWRDAGYSSARAAEWCC